MANIDAGFRAPLRARPHAIVDARRSKAGEDQPAPSRPAPRPKFCRVNAGQLIRALILVVLCLGVVQLSPAEKRAEDGSADAAAARGL
jgi:hypothetical protein